MMAEATPSERAFEEQYRAAKAALSDAKPASSQGLVLVISMVLFAVSISSGSPVRQILVTLGVIGFHELGHYIGMRVFGYQDVRMFFIPFFGAAVSGKRRGVAAWKDGVVSLLGPLPGIALGFVLTRVWAQPSPVERDIVLMLLVINVLNLLPLGGLDGSRFLQRVLFSRHRYLEIAFLTIAGVALLIIAITRHMWVIAIFAYLGLAVLPLRHRVLRAAHGLKENELPPGDAYDYEVYLAARDASHPNHRGKPNVIAGLMEQIVEAMRPPPSGLASVGLIFAWLAGFVLAVVAFAARPAAVSSSAAAQSNTLIEYPIPGGGFLVSMPAGGKRTSKKPAEEGILSIEEIDVDAGEVAYRVHVETMGQSFPDEAHAALVETNIRSKPDLIEGPVASITRAGLTGLSVIMKSKKTNGRCRATYLFDGSRDITLMHCVTGSKVPSDSFSESFRRVN